MKIPRGALIFAGIIIAVVIAVGGMVAVSSLLRPSPGGESSPIQDFFSSLFPFGNQVRPPGQGGVGQEPEDTRPVPILRQVSAAPIAGFRFGENGALRYAERETGHFFETRPEAYPTTRLTNTTLTAIQNIVWLTDSSVVLQYLDQNDALRNYAAVIATSSPDQALLGRFLTGAEEVYAYKDGAEMLYAVRTANGFEASRLKSDETGRATIFTSPLRSWRLVPTDDDIYIQTSPSSGPGFLYRIENGSLSRIAGNISGLMATPRADGKYIAFSIASPATAGLYVYDAEKNRSTAMPLGTYAEKCAWLPGDTPRLACGVSTAFPISVEDWYMGTFSTNDSVWIIDVQSGVATAAQNLESAAGRPLDVTRPAVSTDGKYFGFVNKEDQSLWSLLLP